MTTAADALDRALVSQAARGWRPACSDPNDRRWLSEHKAERDEAARLCTGCAVLAECAAAADEQRETFGVWGGVDRTRRGHQDTGDG